MTCSIRLVDYFYATARDAPGEAYSLLSNLAAAEINLLAFSAIPVGPTQAQFTLFPEDPDRFKRVAERSNIPYTGPHHAFLLAGLNTLRLPPDRKPGEPPLRHRMWELPTQ